jgi:UDP-glucose 4-epimerase
MPMLTEHSRPASTILVVGAAGFIGSHMVLALQEAGYHALGLDNLATGHRESVLNAALIIGDMADPECLDRLFSQYNIIAVMHFASYIEVAESVQAPLKYYQNNVANTLSLLAKMQAYGIENFIFSSTAAVYGEPQYVPIDELHPLQPVNPYGYSKWMVEQIIQDIARSQRLNYAILRYFNAAGADPAMRIGERHEPESHLIPLILQVAAKKRPAIVIYGNDYPSKDGTCIRDFIHVSDLCQAHLLALQALLAGQPSMIANLGTGYGSSVLEVINIARKVTACDIPIQFAARRLGDPMVLVADARFAKKQLHWQPRLSDLNTIIKHAWGYYQTRENIINEKISN